MRFLSLFDGMACGYIAALGSDIEVESYDAYEIDKYAIKVATHNFPDIKEHGDVFNADFTQYEGVDFGIGGSPCTHWSIAQTKNRETTVSRDSNGNVLLHQSGIGVELFSQFLRMLSEAKPKFFIYENNKSMSKEIRTAITECFGFEPTEINSALVSAQNRQRLYWVGRRNEDGSYSKVKVEQPKDRGILLKDVLDSAVARDLTCNDKSYTLTASYDGACAWNTIERHQRNMVAEPIEPRCVAQRGRYPENPKSRVAGLPTEQMFEARADGKTNTLTTVQKDNYVAEPITDIRQVGAMPRPNGELSTSQAFRVYDTEAKSVTLKAQGGGAGAKTRLYAIPAMPVKVGDVGNGGQGNRVYSVNGKAVAQTAQSGGIGSNTGLYAIPYAIEFDADGRPIKAIGKDGKEITIYEVRDGKITIKGKQYPIMLKDAFYTIRKLTVSECRRLQTVPEWYDFSVISNSQAYKCLGNGWTCEVITHLMKACLASNDANVLPGQIGLW